MKTVVIFTAVFLAAFYLPLDSQRFNNSLFEGLFLVRWYAREHVILCLLPAFFIAGAMAVFIGKDSILRYLGRGANKVLAYGVASISGSILAVCSCTVLPLFAGISKMGAGLGPATAFLYAGPAINVLAIILTVRILGVEIGIARGIGAIVFSIVIGLLMDLLFGREEEQNRKIEPALVESRPARALWQNVIYFGSMVGILVFANWGEPGQSSGIWTAIYDLKWPITAVMSIVLAILLVIWLKIALWKVALVALVTAATALPFSDKPIVPFAVGAVGLAVITAGARGEASDWFDQTWIFTKQILPLLLIGVLVSGLLLGRPGHEGLIPAAWIYNSVGGNSAGANLFASIAGAFMYFATLTEVPILQGLMGSGMGKGPALALLLAGPAVSLPNMLVIRSIMGNRKTAVYILLVVIMSTITGMIYGAAL